MSSRTVLQVRGLKKYFPIKKGILKRTVGWIRAVDDVSFSVPEGQTLGLVGESGCGKTTTGRCILRLYEPTAGSIQFRLDDELQDIVHFDHAEMRRVRQRMQIIFQDPFSSLDPRMTVHDIIAEPLLINRIGDRAERSARVEELLEMVGLNVAQLNRYPHEFSGGQRQRIGIARALALNPEVIVCDEPVSALDVSVQAQVLNLLMDLQDRLNLTYLFIAHDLSVVEYISKRVVVMYLGKIVEIADADDLYQSPRHPYTEALLGAIPIPDPLAKRARKPLTGTVPSAANPPSGCNFQTRCPYVQDICEREEPPLAKISDNRYVACHFADELNLTGFSRLYTNGIPNHAMPSHTGPGAAAKSGLK
jgi:oligopeptide/dipeptide ABC transporter ATP-binding protein